MFDSIIDTSLGLVARILAFFYDVPAPLGGSFGLAIIMLTLFVMVLLMPLTLKATRSTIKMTQLQPKLRELQKKHKDDKQTLNTEMMALYQSEGVNPVGGCLPMLAQLPVFLILFNVLRGLARKTEGKPFFQAANHAAEVTGRASLNGESFDPQYLEPGTQMYTDLTDPNRTSIDFGPFDLGASASDIFSQSIVSSLPYLALIALVVGSSYYQQRQISARRGDGNEQMTQQQKTQQQLLKVLPLMSGAWSFVFPTGLVLYWATSNLFRIGQQSYITRSLYSGDAPGAQMLKDQAARREEEDDESSDDDAVDGDVDGESSGGGSKGTSSGGAKSGGGKSGGSKGKTTNKNQKKSQSNNGSDSSEGTNGATANGSDASVGSSAAAREQRWAERRAQKAKVQARRSASSSSGSTSGSSSSNRITPKGTKPTSSKKNKRKR